MKEYFHFDFSLYRQPVLWAITFIFLCGAACPAAAAEPAKPTVVFLKDGSCPFTAPLESDPASGVVIDDETLVGAEVNGEEVDCTLSEGNGGVSAEGRLPGLPDGRHQAQVETLTTDEIPLDSSRLLLLIDTAPPEIEWVSSQEEISIEWNTFLFRITDPEGGSGVDHDPEACKLEVTVTGASQLGEATLLFRDNTLHLLVAAGFSKDTIAHEHPFSIRIALTDRAGNEGTFDQQFTTRPAVKEPEYLFCTPDGAAGSSTFIHLDGEILLMPSIAETLELAAGNTRTLRFRILGYSGEDRDYPPELANHTTETQAPRFFNLWKLGHEKRIGEAMEVTSGSGRVTAMVVQDADPRDGMLQITLQQEGRVPMGDAVDTLQVRYPAALAYAENARQYLCDPGYPTIDEWPEDAFEYLYRTITIPVLLEPEDETLRYRVDQEKDRLVASVEYGSMDLMDLESSTFTVDGVPHWFERQGAVALSSAPVAEGLIPFDLLLDHRMAVFRDRGAGSSQGSSRKSFDGEFFVRLAPPVIRDFRYDRTENRLSAIIDDEGTPLGRLKVELRLSNSRLNFSFDADNGRFRATLPFVPLSVVTATLSVKDLADQTTVADCTLYGEPEEPEDPVTISDPATDFGYQELPAPGSEEGREIGFDGRTSIMEICVDRLEWGLILDDRFIPIVGTPESVSLIALVPVMTPLLASPGIPDEALYVKVFYGSYDRTRYTVAPTGSSESISFVPGGQGRFSGPQRIYYIIGYDDPAGTFSPVNQAGVRITLRTRRAEECRIENRDTRAPVIQAHYDADSGQVTAAIHDHGMPLDTLAISFYGYSDTERSGAFFQKNLPFQYSSGVFAGQFDLPDNGEYFTLVIRATDRSNNTGVARLKVVVPRSPPRVNLTVVTGSGSRTIGNNAVTADALLTAEAEDDSRIPQENIWLWLDGQPLPPFSVDRDLETPYQGSSTAFYDSPYQYRGHYAARLEEGVHQARFRAMDSLGLSAETSRTFDFNLAPEIRDFRVLPTAVRDAGGPALSAIISDRGKDLDASGIKLAIDGQAVDGEHLYYHPASGYFSVSSQLAIPTGNHMALLTAVDGHGNSDKASLRFVRRAGQTEPAPAGNGGLAIHTVSLMELDRHNGDGEINPGEEVRLFVSLVNNGDEMLTGCRATLTAEPEAMRVETAALLYGDLEAGSTAAPVRGFDLAVGGEILEATASDPFDTHLILDVECDGDETWPLPFVLPVYRPTLPVSPQPVSPTTVTQPQVASSVRVRLDPLPASTTKVELVLRGDVESTGSYVSEMTLVVNGEPQGVVQYDREGGRFEVVAALVEGDNVIEVIAVDETGATGADSGYILRTVVVIPPAITITTPVNGDFFRCNELVVSGTYSTGTSSLDAISVNAPWRMGSCELQLPDDSHFIMNCGPVTDRGGTYDVTVRIYTNDESMATDTIQIVVGDCS